MVEIKGKAGIVVKVLADSINEQGNRLTTFELIYARLIHSEILTHKMLCSNSASSRAIPFAKMAEQLTALPVRFGQANPGMQDKGEDFIEPVELWTDGIGIGDDGYFYNYSPNDAWFLARSDAMQHAMAFYNAGYHKQVYNRLTEPFQMMKTIISGTEWDNFFWLRNDSAADPTIAELARCMQEARDESIPQLLKAGEWHLPYVDKYNLVKGVGYKQVFYIGDSLGEHTILTLDQAIKVSCARTAAISFRNEDYGLEKCLEVYARLIGDERKHASAMQHAATPMHKKVENIGTHMTRKDYINIPSDPSSWEKGISHSDRSRKLWSAQYEGWIMHRKTIPGENYVNG